MERCHATSMFFVKQLVMANEVWFRGQWKRLDGNFQAQEMEKGDCRAAGWPRRLWRQTFHCSWSAFRIVASSLVPSHPEWQRECGQQGNARPRVRAWPKDAWKREPRQDSGLGAPGSQGWSGAMDRTRDKVF